MEVEMHHIWLTTFTKSFFLVLATASSLSFADGNKDVKTAMQPRQILDDCVQALQAGDFRRYVGHLSADEQMLQAGYVLSLDSLLSQHGGDLSAEPEWFLLTCALSDLVKQHTIPESQRTPEYPVAEEARQKVLGQVIQTAFVPAGMPTETRRAYIKSAGILRDPQRFLVAALTEAARPTHVSGVEAKENKSPVNFGELAKACGQEKWILHMRGDYTLALASAPQADAPQADANSVGQNAVDAGHAPVTALPLRIVFRRIDGVWKIDRLLSLETLMPTFINLPAQ